MPWYFGRLGNFLRTGVEKVMRGPSNGLVKDRDSLNPRPNLAAGPADLALRRKIRPFGGSILFNHPREYGGPVSQGCLVSGSSGNLWTEEGHIVLLVGIPKANAD